MIQRELSLIRSLLPAFIRGRAYIAGGAAIAPHTADDIDVWVFTTPEKAEQLTTFARSEWPKSRFWSICDFPSGQPLEGLEGDELAERLAYLEAQETEWADLGIELMARMCPAGSSRPIQFFTVTKAGVLGLLNRFDISTHQWAVHVETNIYTSVSTSTLPSQLPRVVSERTPARTLQRLLKVLQRYGWDVPQHPDIPTLQDLSFVPGTSPAAARAQASDLTSAA